MPANHTFLGMPGKSPVAVSLVALAAASTGFAGGHTAGIDHAELANSVNTNKAKNAISLISDGNGVGTNHASRLWAGQQEGGFGDEDNRPHDLCPMPGCSRSCQLREQTRDRMPFPLEQGMFRVFRQ